jgi:hypothetical protein
MKSYEFETKVDGKVVKVLVKRPDAATRQKGDLVRAKALKEAVQAGAMFRENLINIKIAQGTSGEATDPQQDEIRKVRQRLHENSKKVPDENGKTAVSGVTAGAAKEASISMRIDRALLNMLLQPQIESESSTAEALADNQQFNYLVAACTKNSETGTPIFKDVEDYLARQDRDEEVALKAASYFAYVWRGLDPDFEKELPENKYLTKVGFFVDGDKGEAQGFDLLPDPVAPQDPVVQAGNSSEFGESQPEVEVTGVAPVNTV